MTATELIKILQDKVDSEGDARLVFTSQGIRFCYDKKKVPRRVLC